MNNELSMKQAVTEMGIYFPKRFRIKNKNNYINYVINKLVEKNINYELITKKSKPKSNHLVIGNLEKAEKIVLAGYDTADLMLENEYLYTPLNNEKVVKKERLNSLKCFSFSLLLLVIVVILTFNIKNYSTILKILAIIMDLILTITATVLARGLSKKMNVNANSAGVSVIYKLALETKFKKTAFVLVDNVAMLSIGYVELLRDERVKDKEIIILNCIGQGNNIFVCHNEKMNDDARKIQSLITNSTLVELTESEYEKTIVGMFEKSILIFAGDKLDTEYVVYNTRNKLDYKADVDKLENIYEALKCVLE